MAYFVIDKITNNDLKNFINIFLVRNPEKSIPSYHYATKRYGIHDIELKEYGYKELKESIVSYTSTAAANISNHKT
ncbi:MAG: hypothetical protein GY756_14795 [bacterium]|nr:hypothetical protein [bacterium]